LDGCTIRGNKVGQRQLGGLLAASAESRQDLSHNSPRAAAMYRE